MHYYSYLLQAAQQQKDQQREQQEKLMAAVAMVRIDSSFCGVFSKNLLAQVFVLGMKNKPFL